MPASASLTLLLVALLIPWMAGYFWLAVVERTLTRSEGSTTRQIGYGLFLGFAVLQATVLGWNAVAESVNFWPIFFIMLAVAAIGAGLFWKIRLDGPQEPVRSLEPEPQWARVLFYIMVSWAILHLVLSAIEILHQPIFPWDAWLNWMYRAKVWYFSEAIFTLDNPADWIASDFSAPYNVTGNAYPTFPSVIALWAALALQQWSETLVNLPVVLCGIALALAMYGQAREYGLPRWAAAVGAYMLLSLPLIGAHLSLAGKADIWMAGFTGLGLISIIRGLLHQGRRHIWLGLVMVALGMAVKNEGTVWLLAALLILVLVQAPRVSLMVLAIALVGAALASLMDVTFVELPLLGGLGILDGRLHLPLLGNYALQGFDLLDDYWSNLITGGSWHLLWPLTLCVVGALLWRRPGRLGYVVMVFYAVLLATQLVIFEATEQGRWAEDWTAINRVLLHFAPPLIFCLLITAKQLLQPISSGSLKGFAWLSVAALSLTVLIVVGYLMLTYPNSGAKVADFPAESMQIRVGEGRLENGAGIITGFENNIAVISSAPVALNTAELPLLHITTSGRNQKRATFFWRRQQDPQELYKISLNSRGTQLIDLSAQSSWTGTVSEVGLIFYNDQNLPVHFNGAALKPYSLTSMLQKAASDWGQSSRWSQKSVNWLPAGAEQAVLPLGVVLMIWLAAIVLLGRLAGQRLGMSHSTALLTCIGIAWCLMDLRWTLNRSAQATDTIRHYPLVSASYLAFGEDDILQSLVAAAVSDVAHQGNRLLIMADARDMDFQILRAKYHALPVAAYAHQGRLHSPPIHIAENILVLRPAFADPNEQRTSSDAWAANLVKQSGRPFVVTWDKPGGFLIQAPNTSKDAQKTMEP